MYGLEKKNKEPFLFDLEEEIVNDPKKEKQYLELVTKRVEDLKTIMRRGDTSDNFDQLGVLLQGYTALNKVLSKIVKQKS